MQGRACYGELSWALKRLIKRVRIRNKDRRYMKEQIIDCRGLACPAPVLKAKETIDRGQVDCLVMLVDNEAARENVSRFLSRAGYVVRLEDWEGAAAVVGERAGRGRTCRTRPGEADGPGANWRPSQRSWCWQERTGWAPGMIFWGSGSW